MELLILCILFQLEKLKLELATLANDTKLNTLISDMMCLQHIWLKEVLNERVTLGKLLMLS